MIKRIKNKIFRLKKHQRGFTFIEILVSVTLFSVTIISATGIFKSVSEAQHSALASQNIQESVRYSIEVISKEMRMAIKSDGECKNIFSQQLSPTYKIFNITSNESGDILYFKNKDNECTGYYLESGRLAIDRDSAVGYITPSNIMVSDLKFVIIDNNIGSSNSVQPKVTIKMEVEAIGREAHKQKINSQTTISSRNYE